MKICDKSRELGFIEYLCKERNFKENSAKKYLSLTKKFNLELNSFILNYIEKEFPHLFRDKTKLKNYTLDELKLLLSEDKEFILVKHLKGEFRKWYWTENLSEVRIYEHDYNKDTQVTMIWHKYRTLGNMGIDTFLKQLNQGYWLLNEKR